MRINVNCLFDIIVFVEIDDPSSSKIWENTPPLLHVLELLRNPEHGSANIGDQEGKRIRARADIRSSSQRTQAWTYRTQLEPERPKRGGYSPMPPACQA